MSAPGLRALARVELEKAARQPSTWVLGAILVAFVGVLLVAFASILAAPSTPELDTATFTVPIRADALGFVLTIFMGNATILAVVFASMLVAHEFSRGTLRTLLLTGARRRDVLLAKGATLLAGSLLLALLGVLAGVVGAGVFSAMLDERLLRVDATLAWRVVGAFGTFATWAILAATFTLWTTSLGAGIGTTLGLLFVGDLVRGLLAGLGDVGVYAGRVLPNAAVAALGGATPPGAGTWAWVVPSLLAYGLVLPWLALRRFERMDVLGATK